MSGRKCHKRRSSSRDCPARYSRVVAHKGANIFATHAVAPERKAILMTCKLKVGLLASALVGMIVVNTMTLASKTAHDFAYGMLENVAALAIVESN